MSLSRWRRSRGGVRCGWLGSGGQVGVVALGDFGVRAEPALERVVAEAGQQRVVLGLRDAGRVRGQLGGERYRVQRRVQPWRPEDPDRLPGATGRAGQHPVHGGDQVAVRRDLQHLPDVDHQRAGQRRHVDPLLGPRRPGLQAAGAVLEQQGQEPPVGVRPDALRVRAVGVVPT